MRNVVDTTTSVPLEATIFWGILPTPEKCQHASRVAIEQCSKPMVHFTDHYTNYTGRLIGIRILAYYIPHSTWYDNHTS